MALGLHVVEDKLSELSCAKKLYIGSPSPECATGDIETVELMMPEQGGLGLLIFEPEEQPGVFVQEVVKNKAAYLDGRLRPGDRILAINGEKIYNAGQNYVVSLLKV